MASKSRKNKKSSSKGAKKTKETKDVDESNATKAGEDDIPVGQTPKKARKTTSVSNLGTVFNLKGWSLEEEKRLVEEVNKLGGKIPGWYIKIVESGVFGDRSKASINSQYNSLLRNMSPLIDPAILEKEKNRRDKTKERQQERIRKGQRAPLCQDNPALYHHWYSIHGTATGKYQGRKFGNQSVFVPLVTDASTEEEKLLIKTSEEYQRLYRKVYWAKLEGIPCWPCVTVPPNAKFAQEELEDGDVKESIQEVLKSEEKTVFVYWFGHDSYSVVDIDDLYPFTSENAKKYLNAVDIGEVEGHGYSDIMTAYVEAELFIRGRPANTACETVMDLCWLTVGEKQSLPLSEFSDNPEYRDKTPNEFEKDVHAYIISETDEFSEIVDHYLKVLCTGTFNRRTLLRSETYKKVQALCFAKNRSIAELAQSLLKNWNVEFNLFQL